MTERQFAIAWCLAGMQCLHGVLAQPSLDTAANRGPGVLHPWPPPMAAHHFLEVRATAVYDASAIRNELMLGLWRGEELSRELRQRSANTRSGAGRAGYVLDAGITYAWGERIFGHRGIRPRIMVGHHDVLGLTYGDALYQVTFFGNAAYEGDLARLGPARALRMRYQTFGIGLESRDRRSFMVLQWVNGQRLNTAEVERADLFTATDGRYLLLGLDGRYLASDTAAGGGGLSNGGGVAVSGARAFRCAWPAAGSRFTVGVDHLGFLAWNQRTLQVDRDTVLRYEGFRVDDVLDLDGALVGAQDLQDTLGLGYARGSRVTMLPARFHAGAECAIAPHWGVALLLEQRLLPGFAPLVRASALARMGGRSRLAAQVSFGGFGGWRTGLEFGTELRPGLVLNAALPNLIGLAGGRMRGLAAGVGITWAW